MLYQLSYAATAFTLKNASSLAIYKKCENLSMCDKQGVWETRQVSLISDKILMIHTMNVTTLEQFFKENPQVALGFSGGTDSSYLLYAGLRYGAKVKAYFIKGAFQPEFELHDAYRIAQKIGAEITVLEVDVLQNAQVVANPPDRCYFCKTAVFGIICERAKADGLPLVIDGTNASDDVADRPGMKALHELQVRSPLRECGITKDMVRRLSKKAGLFTWNKPAYACLATRIPAGQAITKELLQRIENAEAALFALKFSDFRVRVMGDAAKLQFPQDQLKKAFQQRKKIVNAIKPYFPAVLLDLEERG